MAVHFQNRSISGSFIFELKSEKFKPKIPFFALSFAYRFRISFGTKCESTNLSFSFWLNESQTGDDFFTDSISDKILFEIMKFGRHKNHKNFLKIGDNKKDHKFLWERGSRIEKYSSSFASNSSWLTGILKISDEKYLMSRKCPISEKMTEKCPEIGSYGFYGLFW